MRAKYIGEIEVMNLKTGDTRVYTCEPEKAVVCAYEQDRKNWNAWNYDFTKAQKSNSGRTVSCGDWCAVLK